MSSSFIPDINNTGTQLDNWLLHTAFILATIVKPLSLVKCHAVLSMWGCTEWHTWPECRNRRMQSHNTFWIRMDHYHRSELHQNLWQQKHVLVSGLFLHGLLDAKFKMAAKQYSLSQSGRSLFCPLVCLSTSPFCPLVHFVHSVHLSVLSKMDKMYK